MTEEMKFTPAEGEIQPPLGPAGLVGEEIEAPAEVGRVTKIVEGVPLHPATVKIVLRGEGLLLAHLTKFDGWIYNEEMLRDFGELAEQLEIKMNPLWQFVTTLVAVHMVNFSGYMAWKKMGKPQEEGISGTKAAVQA